MLDRQFGINPPSLEDDEDNTPLYTSSREALGDITGRRTPAFQSPKGVQGGDPYAYLDSLGGPPASTVAPAAARPAKSADPYAYLDGGISDAAAPAKKSKNFVDRTAEVVDPAISRIFGDTKPEESQIDKPGLARYKEEQKARNAEIAGLRAIVDADKDRPVSRKVVETFMAGFVGTAGSVVEGVGMGLDSQTLKSIGDAMSKAARAFAPEDPTLTQELIMGGGSLATFYGPGLIFRGGARLLGAGKAAANTVGAGGSAVLESAAIAQETYEKALSETGNEDLAVQQAWKAAGLNLPLSFITNKIGLFGEKGGRVRRGVVAGLGEGVQETSQNTMTNVLGFKPAGEGATKSFFIGSVTGGGAKMTVDAVNQYFNEASPEERKDILDTIIEGGRETRQSVFDSLMGNDATAKILRDAGISSAEDPAFVKFGAALGRFDREFAELAADPEVGPKLVANGILDPEDPRVQRVADRVLNAKQEIKSINQILETTRTGDELTTEQKDQFNVLSAATNARELVDEITSNPELEATLKNMPGTAGYNGNRYNQIMGLWRSATLPKASAPIVVGSPTKTLTGKENLPAATTGKETPGLLTSVEQINAELAKEEKRTQDAFRLAEVRRQRAQQEVELSGVQPMDTQAGGRPGGVGAQQEFAYFNPVIKDGQMVSGDRVEVVSGDQILDRITLGGLQVTPERAIFLRFLDRPGQPEFPVPLPLAKQFVKFLNRPESPRAAQDFADTAVAPRPGVMTDPEATRGGPRLATDRITTDQRQQFVAADQTPPGTGVAPTRGGRTFEAEPVSEKLEAPGAARAKAASQRLSAQGEGQTSTQPAASTVGAPSASQTPSEAPGAAKAKKTSKRKTKKTTQPEGVSDAAQEGNQQQGDQQQRPGDVAGREAGGREDRQRQAQEPQARAEDRGRGRAEEGGQGQLSLDLKRKYLGEDIQSIDELNRVVTALVKKEDPNGTFKADRVPLGDLVGKLPGVGLIEQTAKLFGKRVVFFRVTEGADFFDGTILQSDDAIFVNVVSDRAHIRIFGHELVHDLRKTKPKVYQQLTDALQPMLDERGFANYAELQKSEGVTTAEKILEEAIGDIVGDRFGETEFWQMMADNNPSTFKDVARAVMSFIDRVLGKLGNRGLGSETLVKDLRAARSEIARILAQSGGEGVASQGSGPAFARKRDGVARDNTAAYVTDKELRKVRAILPDHPDAAEHLRMRELHLSKGTGDYKNERRVLEKDGFRVVIGRVTTQDWIDRVLSAMTPQEVLVFRHWYRDTVGEFKAKFGDRWQEYMIAYLLGNKAESPRGALNNALFVAETTGAGGRSERLGGLSDEQMKQIFAGEAVSLNGIGAKLYDFVDSALGKTTRSWMGNAIEGASPFVVDRHTFRDSGRVDPLLRDWLESKFGAEAVRGIVLDTPATGSVSSAQYEQITDWGNALADDLNSRGFGGGNLMPLEVQAIGWMAMTRLTETNAGGTTEGAMAGMTKTVAAELDFGAGTPFSKKFAAYYDLSKEAQKRVTHEALREVMAVAGELTGVRLVDVTPGIGGWADVVSPNVVARFMSSDQTAEALVATVAYLGQQTSVLALHPANAATGDRVSFEITGPDMSDSFVESTLWKAISKELEPVFGRNIGFMPSVGPDGAPSIRIAIPLPFGNKKNGEPKTVKDFNVGERLELERRLVDQVSPAIERALGSLPSGTYEFDYMRVKGVESVNEWTKKGEQNGESHKQRVGERFGPEVQGRLDSVGVPRVERAIIAAIRRENPAASFSRKRKTPAAADSRGVPQSGGVRGGNVPLEVDGREDSRIGEPLEGGPRQVNIPGVGLVRVGKFQPAVEAAQAYMARAGLQYTPPKTFARVDPDRARRIADEYDRMAHAPGNPEVRAAYDAMIAETVAQYRAILDTGLQIEFIDFAKTGDPYAASPRLAIQDVVENNHLWVFSTADGFGSNESFTPDQNPLLRDTGFAISGKPALANDLFRVVHDYFGHIKNGVGFRADGEENAWRAHSAMYTPLARRAMTSETRGQNSWVNFGPNAEANRGASSANTVYADQKTGLLPEWVSTEGAEDAPSFSRKRDPHKDAEQKKLNEGPSWFQDLPPEAQESLRKVGAVPAKLSFRDRVDALKENLASRMVQGIFDPYAPIAKLGDVPYKQARMSTNVTGAFGHIVTDGEVKWEGGWLAPVKGSKGMLDILKQLPEGEVDRFMWWIAANRAEKLSREEREFLFSGRDIAVLKRLNMPNMGTKMPNRIAVYAKVLKELNQLNKSVLDVAKQSGLINQEQYARFAADAFYIPFYRVMEDGDVAGPATAAGLVGQQFSKRLKGGREQLNDLLANYMNNWEHIIHASAKNMAGRSTLDAAVDAGIATEVKGDPPKGSVKVMVDGKPKHFTVSDPLVFDAISSIYTPALQGMGVKIGSAFKRVFTRTVTASPTFKFYNNLIRDAITSQAISPELSNNPIANTYRGFKLMSKDNPLYDSMLVGGGLFKFSTWDEGDRHEYVKRLIDKGVDSKTILNTPDKIKAFMSNVWGKYMEVGDRAENAQRAAIYDAAIKAGKSQLEASFAARQVIDFSLTGKWAAIRYAAAVLPFFNARLQGMYSLGKLGIAPTIRASRDKDASLSDKQRAARFSAVTLAVTAATIALYLANYEDEDFKRREDWDRDSFWWIKINGVSWRIPKPFEIGAFATIVERGLEQIVDKSVEGKVFGKRLWAVVTDQLSINLIPQLIRPAFDVYSNKDGFRETDIESPGMRRLPIEDRVGANTSYAARAMGAVSKEFADILEEVIGKETADKFQFSPVQIDYLIKGYLGWVGTQALMLSDAAVRAMSGIEAPTPRFQERIPVRLTLGNTIQELPTSSSRYVGDFYRQAREINEIMAAIREYERARDFDKARELREKEEDKVQLSGLYSRTQRSLSEINKELRRIRDDADMNADEKRARIDQLEEIREEYAKSAEDTRKARR